MNSQIPRVGFQTLLLSQSRRTLAGHVITLNEHQLPLLLDRLQGRYTALPFPVHLGPKGFFFAWNNQALHALLGRPGVIDWSSSLRFQYTDDLNPAVMKAIQTEKRCVRELEVFDFWTANVSTIKYIKPPKRFHISPFCPDQASFVNATWKDRDQQYVDYIKHLLVVSASTCLYNTEGDIVGFAVRYHDGEMGMLHVYDTFRRQGHAKVIMSHLARSSIERDEEVFAFAKNSEDIIKVNEAIGMSRLPHIKMLHCVLDDDRL